MSFIAAMILLNVQYEENAFWCFVYIMLPKKGLKTCLNVIKGKHNWRKMFIDGMPKVFSIDRKIKTRLHKECNDVLI
jgi:hypothetical protein